MARYVVLDTSWLDDAVSFGAHTGREIDRFHTLDCAVALTLQRMASGDLGVIVVDLLTNERVFPASAGDAHDEDPPGSGMRVNSAAADTTARSRVKSSA